MDIDSQILDIAAVISEDSTVYITHRSLHNKYSAFLRQSNLRWAQRSRLMWMLNGDLNTSFFHTSGKMNKHKNSIFQILDQQGNIQTSKDGIEQITLNHFSNLWFENSSFSFSDLMRALPLDLPSLSPQDTDQLIRKVSKR